MAEIEEDLNVGSMVRLKWSVKRDDSGYAAVWKDIRRGIGNIIDFPADDDITGTIATVYWLESGRYTQTFLHDLEPHNLFPVAADERGCD